eukprot:sb/3472513/
MSYYRCVPEALCSPDQRWPIKVPLHVLFTVQIIIYELGTTRICSVYILCVRWLVDGCLRVLGIVVRVFPVLISGCSTRLFAMFRVRVHGWSVSTVLSTSSPPLLSFRLFSFSSETPSFSPLPNSLREEEICVSGVRRLHTGCPINREITFSCKWSCISEIYYIMW